MQFVFQALGKVANLGGAVGFALFAVNLFHGLEALYKTLRPVPPVVKGCAF
jgi:hypothetical protein